MPTGTQEGIIRGIYPLKKVGTGDKQVQLLGSGTLLREVEKAAQMKYNLEWCWRQYANRHLHAVNPRHLG
jgi:pyruvate dehydrogenase complex dehydrogenase (E1) component